MNERRAKRLVVLIMAGIAFLSMPVDAHAVLRFAASVDGGGTIFAIDNDLTNTCGAGPIVGPCQLPDINPAVGALTLAPTTAAGGDLDFQFSTQTQDVAPAPGQLNRLDSTGTQVTNNGAVQHMFQVAIGATNFAGPVNTATATGAGQWSTLGAPFGNSQITMRWFDDPANSQGGITPGSGQPGNMLASFLDTAGPGNPDSFSTNQGPFVVNDPALFAMSLQFDAVLGAGVRLTGRELTEVKSLTSAVPEPSTLLLLGSAVGLIAWRRRTSL